MVNVRVAPDTVPVVHGFFKNGDGGSWAMRFSPLRVNIFHVIACKYIRETPTSKLKTRRTYRTPHLRKALH